MKHITKLIQGLDLASSDGSPSKSSGRGPGDNDDWPQMVNPSAPEASPKRQDIQYSSIQGSSPHPGIKPLYPDVNIYENPRDGKDLDSSSSEDTIPIRKSKHNKILSQKEELEEELVDLKSDEENSKTRIENLKAQHDSCLDKLDVMDQKSKILEQIQRELEFEKILAKRLLVLKKKHENLCKICCYSK